jgi:hypothetical protein
MNKATFQFNMKELNLNVSLLEKHMGYKEGEDREIVTDIIGEVLEEAEEISDIKAEYIVYNNINFNISDKSLDINSMNFQIRKIIFGQIKKSESISVFLCTAGEEISYRSSKAMQDGDLMRGYVYDVVGSVIVEAAADLMQKELEKALANSGKNITNRYSPGYCKWDVAEQHKLFQLIPDNFCGIRLTESALMDPVKSVSGIIGIGAYVKRNTYICNLCDMKDCIYRKAREK